VVDVFAVVVVVVDTVAAVAIAAHMLFKVKPFEDEIRLAWDEDG